MYFFDLFDYYGVGDISSWLNNGVSGVGVGCTGGPIPSDFQDYFSFASQTKDAFVKSVNEWFIASKAGSSYELASPIDDGCLPTYDDLWYEHNDAYVIYEVAILELKHTIILYEYYYNMFYSLRDTMPQWDVTYEEYKDYWVNTVGDYYTGSTSITIQCFSAWPDMTPYDVPVTLNYGTTFTQDDLIARIANYESAIKGYMCSVKKMMSVMDGDTFDEYVYDENGNYNINNIGIV
jgi:hypothetical protein